jgi:uncharacterized protein YecT (DUF1311 family)
MKHLGKILIVTSALNLGIGVLTIQNPKPVLAQVNCQAPQTVNEANDCYQQADTTLNAVYLQLLYGLRGERQQQLIAAEQGWIQYRDANCAFRASKFDGAMARLFYFSCLDRMTRERTQQVQEELQGR